MSKGRANAGHARVSRKPTLGKSDTSVITGEIVLKKEKEKVRSSTKKNGIACLIMCEFC